MFLISLALASEPPAAPFAEPTAELPADAPVPAAPAAPAAASPPEPTAAPAPAETPSSTPAETPTPAAAPPASSTSPPTPPASPADPAATAANEALLAALLALHGEQRIAGIAALVGTNDPRAVPVLVDVVQTLRAGPVADRATLALASFPEGPQVLGSWVIDRRLPTSTRIAAARALGAARSEAAADALLASTGARAVAGTVRSAVMDTLKAEYPDRVGTATRVSDAGSIAWTTLGFGTGLGYGVATLGHFGRTNLEGLGAAAGAVGGATGGWFYANRRPTNVGDSSHVTLAEWAGTTGGLLIASGTGRHDRTQADQVWVGGLIGLATGAGAGLATAGVQQGTGRDAWETGILTGAGVATLTSGYGFFSQGRGSMGTSSTAPRNETIAGFATLGSFAGASIASPNVDLRGTDLGFVALGTTWGAVVGGWLPLPPRTDRNALPVMTGGVAGLTAWSLAPAYDRPGDELLGGFLGLGFGTTIGAGISELAAPGWESPASGWGPVAGATGGMIAGIGLANLDPGTVDGSDLLWGGLATGWVTWQTTGWIGLDKSRDRDYRGVAVTVVGATGTACGVASRWTRVPYSASLTMASTALWGTYIGAATAQISHRDPLQAALIGGDIGVGVGAISLVPNLQVAPVIVGFADLGGVVVGGTTTLIAGLASQDPNALLAASLIGAGVGTAGGALLGLKVGSGHQVTLNLPHVDPPGVWGMAPMVSVAEDGRPVYGATVMGVGW